MARTITMPRFGATMEEGTINFWLVKEGEAVKKSDVLGEIAIEKLSNDLLADADGVVLKIIAEAGDTISCGQPILIMGTAGETLEVSTIPTPARKKKANVGALMVVSQPASEISAQLKKAASEFNFSAQITPKALQLAEELGIDYHYVKGSGRFGMVTREDLRAAAKADIVCKAVEAVAFPSSEESAVPVVNQALVRGEVKKMSQRQQSIAKAMEGSLKASAQTTISMDIDASQMVEAYRLHKDEYALKGIKLTYTALLVKIVALALVEHKMLRTVVEDSNLVTGSEINVGVAVDIPDGLVVPNIKQAHNKTLSQVANELADLGNRAKNNTLKMDEMTGGTFTITNLGMFGVKYFTPVLNPGESGILGIGMIQEVSTVQDGGIFIKPIMNLSLTHDHRVINGVPAARFLQTVQLLMNDSKKLFS